MTLLFGAVLALAVDNASAAQPCVVVSDVSSSVPCPCVGGENGVTLGFTLANGRHRPGFPQQSRHKQQARDVNTLNPTTTRAHCRLLHIICSLK